MNTQKNSASLTGLVLASTLIYACTQADDKDAQSSPATQSTAQAPATAQAPTSAQPSDGSTPASQAARISAQNLQPDEVLGRTLPHLAAMIQGGEITSEALVQAYLDRIEAIDRNGPTLRSVIAVNPNALADARALDDMLAEGAVKGPLHGLPILLKDNIESSDPVATTAGALVLKDNITNRDAPLVAGLRKAGAVILGKTNLSQWANFRSNDSISGWSAMGGQVKNPHMLDRSPCGSSSGSGAATAASLAAGAVGTETNGSVICPANVNGIVGFKPTVGLVSQQYIVPISSSQDTAGPMTKTVTGAAMMLSAMVGNTTSDSPASDYVSTLNGDALDGARIGVLRFSVGDNKDINTQFEAALETLTDAGAVLVEIDDFNPSTDNFWGKARDVLHYEFKATLNEYLADAAPGVRARTLDEVIAFNLVHADDELALFDQSIFDTAAPLGDLTSPDYLTAKNDIQTATRDQGIDSLLATHDVSVLVSPSGPLSSRIDPVNGDVWPDWSGAGWMAAIAGYPHITVPMGQVHGIPIGLSFMGAKDQDAAILSYGFAFEQRTNARIEPSYLPNAEAREEIAKVVNRPAGQ